MRNMILVTIVVIAVVFILAFAYVYREHGPSVITEDGDKSELVETEGQNKAKSDIDIQPFTELGNTKRNTASDFKENLWTINAELVVWEWTAPSISDGNYGLVLFGRTPSEQLCYSGASVGGPKKYCTNSAHTELFNRLDPKRENLGLDATYVVRHVYP